MAVDRTPAWVELLTLMVDWTDLARRYRRARRAAASRRARPSTADDEGKESTHSFHFQRIAHRGACGKTRIVPQNRQPRPEPAEMGVAKCRVLFSTTGSRGDVEPMVGLAVRLRTPNRS